MKFGVYGCRHMHIAEAVGQMLELGHECIGVYEPEGSVVEKLIDKYPMEKLSGQEEFFARHPEIVLCASVNNQKIDVIEECERRGAHIMLDKPAVTSRDGYERLEAVIRRGKIKVGLMLTERFNPSIAALREMVETGGLGTIISLSFAKPHKLSPATRESWHFDKKENGGPILDLMIHDFDLIRMLTGSEIAGVHSYLGLGNREGYPDFYDDAKALAVTESGVTALMTADWWTPDSFPCFGNGRIVCTGTKGRCEVYTTGDPLFGKDPFAVISNETFDEKILDNKVPEKNLMQDFLAYLNGEPSDLTGDDVLKASYACLLADEQATIVTVKDR